MLELQQQVVPGQAGPRPAPSSRCRCLNVPSGILAESFPAWSYAGAAFHAETESRHLTPRWSSGSRCLLLVLQMSAQ